MKKIQYTGFNDVILPRIFGAQVIKNGDILEVSESDFDDFIKNEVFLQKEEVKEQVKDATPKGKKEEE